MVRPIVTIDKIIEKKRYITIVDKETYDNFEKNTNHAVAFSMERAKELAKDALKKIKKNPNKRYCVNLLYADKWRASKTFINDGDLKFPDESIPRESSGNTDLYDYVYGIQIIELD